MTFEVSVCCGSLWLRTTPQRLRSLSMPVSPPPRSVLRRCDWAMPQRASRATQTPRRSALSLLTRSCELPVSIDYTESAWIGSWIFSLAQN